MHYIDKNDDNLEPKIFIKREQGVQYSINSWKHFCDKYDCELLVWEDLLFPVEHMKITWQRYYLFDILEGNPATAAAKQNTIAKLDGNYTSDVGFPTTLPVINLSCL